MRSRNGNWAVRGTPLKRSMAIPIRAWPGSLSQEQLQAFLSQEILIVQARSCGSGAVFSAIGSNIPALLRSGSKLSRHPQRGSCRDTSVDICQHVQFQGFTSFMFSNVNVIPPNPADAFTFVNTLYSKHL